MTGRRSIEIAKALAAVVAALVVGCGEDRPADSPPVEVLSPPDVAAGPPWFEEVAVARGIDFTWASGHRERRYLPEIMGGGAALVDVDGDGDLDAYLVQGGSLYATPAPGASNRLYRNAGGGAFEDVTESSGADDRGYGMGVASGDFDNDGDVDLYVTNVGPNVLLRNAGNGTFADVTRTARVGHPGWGTSAAFFDYDRDGDLDLYVANYINWSKANAIVCYDDKSKVVYCSPKSFQSPAMDTLYRNEGDGTFTDATRAAGLDAGFGNGLGVACMDYNGDGWVDVFVANDGTRDQLWENQGDGTFLDRGVMLGCAYDDDGVAKAGMGVTVADVDGDGDPDVLVCNLRGESDSFHVNHGSYFEDVTARSGLGRISKPFTRFGMGWVDFDSDGLLDLYQANGKVIDHDDGPPGDAYAESNLLFRGTGDLRFEEVLPRGGTASPLVATSRAAAFGDVDDDGRVDVLVVNRDARAHLLRNIAPAPDGGGHWVTFRVVNEHGGDALDARIEFTAGDRRVVRTVRAASSYLASNDPRVHVGLGGVARVEGVVVTWADGRAQQFGDFDADRVIELRR